MNDGRRRNTASNPNNLSHWLQLKLFGMERLTSANGAKTKLVGIAMLKRNSTLEKVRLPMPTVLQLYLSVALGLQGTRPTYFILEPRTVQVYMEKTRVSKKTDPGQGMNTWVRRWLGPGSMKDLGASTA